MFDESDDEDLGLDEAGQSGSTDFSAAKRRPAPDFSSLDSLVPGGAKTSDAKASDAKASSAKPSAGSAPRGEPMDFSGLDALVPKTPSKDVPLPRSRPDEAGPAATTELPMPPPRPDLGTPADGDYMPTLEGAPFRSGGRALDTVLGTEGGMLSGDEAARIRKDRIEQSDRGVDEAKANVAAANKRNEDLLKSADLTGEAGDVLVKRALRKRAGLGKAQGELSAAVDEGTAANRATPPTQEPWRDKIERVPGAAVSQVTDMAKGGARLFTGALSASDYVMQRALGITPPAKDPIAEGMKTVEQAADNVNGWVSQRFNADKTQDETLGSKIVQGVTSTGVFALTGAAGRVMGLGAAPTTAIAGALPQAEQQYQQALTAERQMDGYAQAWMKDKGIDASKDTANGIVRWGMFLTGLGIGATEAVPIAHMFDRLERASGGGLTRYIGVIAAQAGEEGVQEGVQQFLQNGSTRALLDPNQSITKDVADNALVGAISGALVTGAFAAPAALSGDLAHIQDQIQPPEPAPVDLTTPGAPPSPPPPPGASPIEQVLQGGSTQQPTQPAVINPPAEQTVAPEPAAQPTQPVTQPPAGAVSALERRTLRKKGYSDEMIDGMGRAEITAELGEAAQQGIEPGAEEAPSAAPVGEAQSDQAMAGLSEMFGGSPAVREGKPADEAEAKPPAPEPETAGTKASPIPVKDGFDLLLAEQHVNPNPTPGQKDAENFKMAHIRWPRLGRQISIETVKGGTRTASDNSWSVPNFPARYGRIKGTVAADGQQIDAFMGDDVHAPNAFIIDQHDPATGKYDEAKVMLGFADQAQAQKVYDAAFTDGSGPQRRAAISAVTIDELKKWLRSGKTKLAYAKKAKPAADTGPVPVGPAPTGPMANAFNQAGQGVPIPPESATPSGDTSAIEKTLQDSGIPPSSVHPGDIAKASEIVAQTGADPADAFEQAVIANALNDGTVTPALIDANYGKGTADAIQSEPAPQHGAGNERESEPGQAAAEPIAQGESEQLPGARKTGEDQATESGAAITAGATDQPAQAAESQDERPGDSAKAEDAGVDTKPAFVETAIDKGKRIEDAGEKIGGARKDAWGGRGMTMDDLATMTGAEKAAKVSKTAVWPRPDYAALVENGMDAKTAFYVKRAYDNIPNAPAKDYTAEQYVAALSVFRQMVQEIEHKSEFDSLPSRFRAEHPDDWRAIEKPGRFHHYPGQITYQDERAAEKAIKEGFPNTEPWQRLFAVREWSYGKDKGKWYVYRKSSGSSIGDVFETRDEADAAAKAAYEGRSKDDKGAEPDRPHLDNVVRTGPDYRQGQAKDSPDFITDMGFRGVEFGNWVAGDERQKTINIAYDALHDLARILNVPAKALSLNGTLGVAFGARGKGGKFSAHYEAHRLVINMTKVKGAGSLAHEWAHALDHYLGEVDSANAYGGAPKSISQWRNTKVDENTFKNRRLPNLSPRLARAANAVMQALHYKTETDEQFKSRTEATASRRAGGLESWEKEAERVKDLIRVKGSSRSFQARLRKAEQQIGVWTRHNAHIARTAEDRKLVSTDYYANAQKIAGSGDYWYRPNELFARAFESYVFDKLVEDNHQSQYLVQGVEGNRFAGEAYKGNAYPDGAEREAINAAFDGFVKALEASPGKHGEGSKLIGASKEDWSAPVLQEQWQTPTVTDITPVKPITSEEKKQQTEDEMKALDQDTTALEDGSTSVNRTAVLAATFAGHLRDGGSFGNILAARKMAKESGFDGDAKAVEEAMELAVVQLAREIAADRTDPKANFTALVDLYSRQPKLGTRTSTSMRDQAFSTPVPLAYVASRLARITPESIVYEPTAGNGALLIEADPKNAVANEINPARAENLRSQGFDVTTNDAAKVAETGKAYDVVIANPPFGATKDEAGQSKGYSLTEIQSGYRTNEIDHVIALRSLAAMKDQGRAVLLLGGVNKLNSTGAGRSDAYNGKAKREFYKTLYDRYNVTDHFTVAGELYERQGAGWPVDVIVIDGRGKSNRALPAVDVPRVLNAWDQLGGMIDATVSGRGLGETDRAVAGASEGRPGVRDGGLREGGGAERVSEREPANRQPADLRAGPDQQPSVADREGQQEPNGDERREPERIDRQPDAERRPPGLAGFDEAFDAALDETFGPQAGPKSSEGVPKAKARTTKQVAKSAVSNAAQSADAAMAGLVQLFGGGKTVGEGLNFDAETYAKAKPLFVQAAAKFSAFKDDLGELVRRMVGEMQKLHGLTRDALEAMRPYLKRFVEEVQSGAIRMGTVDKSVQTKSATPAKQEQETSTQVAYAPQSKAGYALGTLVPVNMRTSVAESLAALEKRVGNIDTYVADQIGYSANELPSYFAAEQIDALALAIDNIERGKGFIIGDQTGIGKGRVNAAIIRWAIKNNRVPVFVTEKPNLYKDMYRDLQDIGIGGILNGKDPRILATNSGLSIPLTDDDNGPSLQTQEPKKQASVLVQAGQGKFTDSYDMVFTTYSQMQTVKGEDTVRRAFLQQIAPNAVLIFDESHNAGGQGSKTNSRAKKSAPSNRSGFARDLVEAANGVFYSSATYAKRPDVMDLYSATDMVMAVEKKEDLAEAIAKGGVPMQQVVASMLAKGGQYIRRERSFAGVTYATPVIAVDHDQYDGISQALALIQDFSVAKEDAADAIREAIKAEAQAMGHDNATGQSGASSVLFTSIMHNIINQMLLAMKAQPVAKMAIEAIKRGEKPVITVANTMESFLSDYAEELGLKTGDAMDADFSRVLQKYLDRSRTLIIKKPFSKDPVVRKYLTDAEMGPAALSSYNRAKAQIDSLDLSDLAVSPIDRIKQDLADAGYKVGEITGRGTVLDYAGDEPVLQNRPGKETSIRGRLDTIKKFNSGEFDAVIINQSGATGLSLHASKTFKDQRKRHMMIAQAEANIDTHMQILGRVHRTGQVQVPTYSQLVAGIPAEKRPAAVLAKKMASLNANTTASRGGALTAKDVPDFINEYGDQVAATIIADDPVLNHRLGNALKIDADSGKITVEDAMRRITGRIPLLPLKEQEELYERLEADYASLLQQMEATGENALEAQTLDLKARPIERTQVVPPKSGSNSPFAAPVHIEKTSMVRQGKPFSEQELLGKIADELGIDLAGESAADVMATIEDNRGSIGAASLEQEQAARTGALEEFATYQQGILDDTAPEKTEKERLKLNTVRDRWENLHQMLRVGARITLKTSSGNITSIVLKVEQTGKTKNPLALSSWKATFAVAEASRQITLPFSRLFEDGKSPSDDKGSIEAKPIGWVETPAETIQHFADMQSSTREERFIATGNLLAAYDWLSMKGRIINYSDEQGHIRQGILTAKDFDLGKHYAQKARPIRDPAEVVAWLNNNPNKIMWSEDDVVRLTLTGGRLHVSTEAAKRTGGVYFLDKQLSELTRDFYKRGPVMTTDIYDPGNNLVQRIVERLQALGAVFVDRSEAVPPPTEKIGESYSSAPAGWSEVEAGPAWRMSDDEIAKVREITRRVAGIDPVLAEIIAIPKGSPGAVAWGLTEEGQAQGMYQAGRDAITIALSYAGPRTAYHEAFHRLQNRLLTAQELEVLARETERLRDMLRKDIARADSADRMDRKEIEAEAFAVYSMKRETGAGLSGLLLRAWSRLATIVRRLRNALNGLGYQTSEDIFKRAYSGEVAGRSDQRAAGAASSPQFSTRRRTARAGDTIPAPETVRGAMDQDKPFKERLSDAIDALLLTPSRALWDRQIDLLRFQKAAEAVNGAQPESLDTYLAATLYPGRVGEQMKDAVKNLWEPVYDDMQKRGVGRDELHEYLYARHAPERNAAIREIDPDNDAGSGMSDEEAAEIMGSLVDRAADFAAIADRIDRIVEHNRAIMLREGLESEATLAKWAETYQHYVPLKGFEAGSDDELNPTPSGGRGFDVRRPESQRALGRFDRADDILANLLDQTQRTIVRAEKNKVAKTFLRFAQGNPSPFYKIGLQEIRRRINELTGLVETYTVNAAPNRDEVFAAKVGGKTYYIEIKHHGLLEALKTLGADKMNGFLRLMARLTREYSRFQTAKNPEFVFTNLVKDMQDAGFTVSAEQQARYTRRFFANILNGRALFGSILGISEKGESRASRRWFEEWRESGGKISHYGLKDLNELRDEVERELNQRTEGTGKTIALAAPRFLNPINGKLVKFLEALSDVTESTTRLAVYIAGREVGLTRAQAARMSRNATVDFNRRGKYGTAIGALYAFANANIQGNVRLLRTLRKSKIARRAFMGIVVAGMVMTYWNMAMSPEDDEKKKAYEKRKYWERERNIIIYGPHTKTAAKIPLGYGLNVPWMMGEQLMLRMLGKVGTVEMLGNLLGTTVSAFNPLGSEGSWFDWKTWVRAYTPTVMRPAPELAFNSNWAGNKIHPDEMPWNKALPHSDQHKAFTHPAAVSVAEFINRVTGGNKFEPGFLSMYPDDVEYGWNFAVGGLGRFMANTSGTIADAVDGVDRPVERIPFVRRFVASDNSPAMSSDAYYKRRSEEQAKAQRLRAAVKARSEGTDDGSADAVIERLAGETGARPSKNGKGISVPSETVFRSSDSQIKSLRKQEDEIRKDHAITPAQRKESIDALRQRMRDVMNEARGRVPAPAQ